MRSRQLQLLALMSILIKTALEQPLSAMPTFALQPNEMSLVKLGLRQRRHGIFF